MCAKKKNTPERGQAARWSPKASCDWPHRHLAAVSGSGRRSRRSRRARNSGESRASSGEVRRAVKMRAANGPFCESSRAAEEASSSRNKARWQVNGLGRGTLPATSVVRLWFVSNERTRHFSMEQVVPGRGFKPNGGQRVAGSLKWQRLRQLACCV